MVLSYLSHSQAEHTTTGSRCSFDMHTTHEDTTKNQLFSHAWITVVYDTDRSGYNVMYDTVWPGYNDDMESMS